MHAPVLHYDQTSIKYLICGYYFKIRLAQHSSFSDYSETKTRWTLSLDELLLWGKAKSFWEV